jgi:hypothetical protein
VSYAAATDAACTVTSTLRCGSCCVPQLQCITHAFTSLYHWITLLEQVCDRSAIALPAAATVTMITAASTTAATTLVVCEYSLLLACSAHRGIHEYKQIVHVFEENISVCVCTCVDSASSNQLPTL